MHLANAAVSTCISFNSLHTTMICFVLSVSLACFSSTSFVFVHGSRMDTLLGGCSSQLAFWHAVRSIFHAMSSLCCTFLPVWCQGLVVKFHQEEYRFEPHFYQAKLWYVGVYLFFLIFGSQKQIVGTRRGGSNVYLQSIF